ncbi:MAG: DUF2063 domain-containing protein [Bacteriovoracaceae bacterium]|jgi:hypothetical protein|nr:DUF2063 domain-containing protein [Bacteriovoracaceae bacterium]
MKFDQNKFQRQFVNAIPSNIFPEQLISEITPVGSLSCEKALNTYHNDYKARLTETLGEFYEAVWMVIGDDEFYKLCYEYILNNPSQSFDLGAYGQLFPEFIKKSSLLREFPFLEDLALLEQDFLKIFHQRVPKSMTFTDDILRNIEHLCFSFSPSLKLNKSFYPVVSIWKCKNGVIQQDKIDFESLEWFCIYKSQQGTFIESLSMPQYLTLSNLLAGDTIQQSLGKLEKIKFENDPSLDIQELFQFIVKSGIVENIN